ncbi:unnamed protein product, partial [marine sediment metagenome]
MSLRLWKGSVAKKKSKREYIWLECTDKWDWTPLHHAAWRGNKDVVELLIAKGADVNTKGSAGYTSLLYAAQSGHSEIAKLLIAKGADIEAKADMGVAPLMVAVLYNHNDIAEMLIAKGAEKTIYVASAQGDAESVKAFLKKDPNLISALAANTGLSALHWAAYQGHLDVIKLLIENGADVNVRCTNEDKTINGITPLFWAISRGHENAAELLINKGADVNARNKLRETALYGIGSLEVAKLLIANGADVNAKED